MERKLGHIKEFFYKNRAVALVVLLGVLLMLLPTGKTETQQPQQQAAVESEGGTLLVSAGWNRSSARSAARGMSGCC